MTNQGGAGVRASTKFERGLHLLRRHLDEVREPSEFELLGRRWTLLEGVFSPVMTPVTELFTTWVPFPTGGSLLEMGSGAGVTAVCAALFGCLVTALDINPAAVENTRLNATRHGVADRLDVRRSDLFTALSPAERYDLVYWNSNFIEPPTEWQNESGLHNALFDPGYGTHDRFIQGAASHVHDGGRLILGFSDLGNWERLNGACRRAGLVAEVIRAERHELSQSIEFQLVELRPSRGGCWADVRMPEGEAAS